MRVFRRRPLSALIGLLMIGALLTAAPVQATSCVAGASTMRTSADKVGRFVDAFCREFYVDAAHTQEQQPSSATAAIRPLDNILPSVVPTDAFKLHSRPGAGTIIYLDFDGFVWGPGTWWDAGYPTIGPSLEGRVSPGFDRDGDPSTFTTAELLDVIEIWAGFAEDFAVFDIDVTTELPTGAAAEVFKRSGSYGLILSDDALQQGCGCGGIAYLDVINNPTPPEKRPALIHTRFSGYVTANYDISEIGVHEVGHNFGLVHDGTSTLEYYIGDSNWSPIMGAGRGAGIVTWSAGGYPDSQTRAAQYSNDDFLAIAKYAPLIPDIVGDDIASAADGALNGDSVTINGLINSATDKDFYKIVVPQGSTGTWIVKVNSISSQPNLDPELVLLDANGIQLASSNPRVATGRQWGVIKAGLDAVITFSAAPGTYYVSIDGVGQDSLSAGTGYSDYASVGNYQLEVITPNPAISSLSAASGGPGTALLISGYNLAQTTSVKVAGVAVSKFTVTPGGQLLTSVPVGAGLGVIAITDAQGRIYESQSVFDGRGSAVAPAIDGVSNRTPIDGEIISITGANVGAATSLKVGGQSVTFKAVDRSTVNFTVRSATRGGDISLTTDGGTSIDSAGFLPKTAPQVDTIAPLTADPGQTITITGANFTAVTVVMWNGLAVAFTRVSDHVITFTAGSTAASDVLTLDGTWGMTKSSTPFTVRSFAPVITSLSTQSAKVGATVRLVGRHLGALTTLQLNGGPIDFIIISDSEIQFVVPTDATSGLLYLESVYGSVVSASPFVITPPAPVVTAMTPKSSRAGTVITISGRNFIGALTVTVGGVKATKVLRVSPAKLRVTIPKTAKTGYILIKAAGGTGRSATKFILKR